MNYPGALNYLLNQLPLYQRIGKLAYQAGLDNALKLDGYFGQPHRQFSTIHVGGTNGKGSVSHMMASVLQEAGLKVGLYTSPHLLDFRERIRVNGQMITKTYVTGFVNAHKPFFDTFHPSFFEISVFLAFCYFEECGVDVAVIEVGLGGRLDATNIIRPVLSVITNISRDHTDILGDTLEKIAAEKAGIIKDNTPVVVGESHSLTLPVFQSAAVAHKSELIVADNLYDIDYSLASIDRYQLFNVARKGQPHFVKLKCGLLGHYQRKNTVTTLASLEKLMKLGVPLREKHIYSGIQKVVVHTGLKGRWQELGQHPLVVCDTAHNPDGLKQVIRQALETPHKELHLVLGFVGDKDVDEILNHLPPNAHYYFARLSVPRTYDEQALAQKAIQYGITGSAFENVKLACHSALHNAGKYDLVLITGSTFLVADYLRET